MNLMPARQTSPKVLFRMDIMKATRIVFLTMLLPVSAKPNFLLIFTDDHGYGDVSTYHPSDVRTPNIDRIARGGHAVHHDAGELHGVLAVARGACSRGATRTASACPASSARSRRIRGATSIPTCRRWRMS